MIVALLILAADTADSVSSLPELPPVAQYGLLGILAFALASGKLLVPRYVYDQQKERADRMEAENVRLNNLIVEKTIPAVIDAANAVRDSTLLVHDLKREKEIEQAARERHSGGPHE